MIPSTSKFCDSVRVITSPSCFQSWSEVIRVETGGPQNLKGLPQSTLSAALRVPAPQQSVMKGPPGNPHPAGRLPPAC